MEQQKGQIHKKPLQSERGRRYAPTRPQDRRFVDVMPANGERVSPRLTENTQEVKNQPPIKTSMTDVSRPKREVSFAKPARPRQNRSLVLKRHIVQRAAAHRTEVRRSYGKHIFAWGGLVAIVAAITVIVWAFWDVLPSGQEPGLSQTESRAVEQPRSTENIVLDENFVGTQQLAEHVTAPDTPRILQIPKLKVNARVNQVGASLNGEPIAPGNIYDTGWFDDSVKPGAVGAVLINGHATGPTKNGVFANLDNLSVADQIILEKGDRTKITYKVVKVQTYPADRLDMSVAMQPIEPGKKGLNIMTTTSRYRLSIETSLERTIVFAVQE